MAGARLVLGSPSMEQRAPGDGSHDANRAYYDEFSKSYEKHRRPNDGHGYHALVDDLEVELCERYGTGRDILECGCGTGLILERLAEFGRRAAGVDLSPGMLELARSRGLEVKEASVTALPFDDATFDVTCSFKVLAHVPEIELALKEMVRVTRPGGIVLAEFYNPYSLRAVLKRVGPAGRIAASTKESQVYTRFDSPFALKKLLPPGTHLVGARGVRIVTPAAKVMTTLLGRRVFRAAERALCDSPLRVFAGFYVAAIEKRG